MNAQPFRVRLSCCLLILAGTAAICSGAPPANGAEAPVLLVKAIYPRANARVLADTIAAPIEEQLRGLEKLVSMRSQCRNDGRYLLALTFQRGADPNTILKVVQTRVNLAVPILPDAAKARGVSVNQANVKASDRLGTSECLWLDVELPIGASEQRTGAILRHCENLLRRQHGVDNVQIFSANPFDLFATSPCILVSLTPAEKRDARREKIAQEVLDRLNQMKEITLRLRDQTNQDGVARGSYPIDLVLHGPRTEQVRKFAEKLDARLRQQKKLRDVWTNRNSRPLPQRILEIDSARIKERGVALEDILATIQVYVGSGYVSDTTQRAGGGWQMKIFFMSGAEDWVKDLPRLKIRNARGDMVAMNALVKVREREDALILDFLDGRPMVEITANLGAGTSRAQARTLCEIAAEEVRKELQLSMAYRWTWFEGLPAAK